MRDSWPAGERVRGVANTLFAFVNRFDRRLWTLFFVQMTVSIGLCATMPFVSLYLYRELGVPMTVVGTIMLIAASVGSIGRVIGGELADRIGRKPLITVAMAARMLIFLVMAYAIHVRAPVIVIACIYLAIRFVGDVVRPGLNAMVADLAGFKQRVEAFAFLRIGMNIGWAVGPALGGFLLTVSYSALFLLTAAASLTGFVLIVLFVSESVGQRESERFKLSSILDVARDGRFLAFSLCSLVLLLVTTQFSSTLSVFSTEFVGITEVQLGLVYTLNGVIVILFQWPAGLSAGRLGTRRALVLGSLAYGAGYFSLGVASSFAWVMGSMTMITFGEIVHSPSATTAVANMAKDGKTGRYMGFFGLAESLGWSGGPFIGGLLMDAYASTPLILWGTIAGMAVVAAAGYQAIRSQSQRAADLLAAE